MLEQTGSVHAPQLIYINPAWYMEAEYSTLEHTPSKDGLREQLEVLRFNMLFAFCLCLRSGKAMRAVNSLNSLSISDTKPGALCRQPCLSRVEAVTL